MDVNDDAGCLNARVARTFIVGTPPGAGSLLQWIEYSRQAAFALYRSAAGRGATTIPTARAPVGASLLAMDVNDDAGCLNARVAWTFFVGTPPGASSLPQKSKAAHTHLLLTTHQAER